MFGFFKRKEISATDEPHKGFKKDGTIDFSSKKLNLVHSPKIQGTVTTNATVNEQGEALVTFRKSFLPTDIEKQTLLEFSKQTLKIVKNGKDQTRIKNTSNKYSRRSRKSSAVEEGVRPQSV